MSPYMKLNNCEGAKTSSLTIVNEGSSLTIENETTSSIKMKVSKTAI